jgi:hypothetical protein
LPIDKMISAPLQAMIQAQTSAAKSYADFLLQVCIQDGKAVAVQFDYDETLVDEQGVSQGTIQKTMRIPLLCAVVHPVIAIEEGTIDFELEISQSEKSSSTTEAEGSFQAKSEQTRSTDTRAKYSFHTQVKRQNPPEALMRVMEFLTNAATKPVVVKGKENEVKPLPATPTDGSMIGEKKAGGNAPAPAPAATT